MKKSLYILFFLFLSTLGFGQDEFTTVWRTTTANESITIPTASGEVYNYTVNWGDGTTVTTETGNATHTYATAGDYTVMLDGTFPKIDFASSTPTNKGKIREVSQWGTNTWADMQGAFFECENMDVTATDAPDLSAVTSLNSMFMFCASLQGTAAFDTWNTSTITDMEKLFFGAASFNQPLANWNTSNVTVMWDMFAGASSFNQPLDNWNTSLVTDMESMFNNATAFDQNIAAWDISSLSFASQMLDGAGLSKANYDSTLIGWNTLDAGETAIPQNITFSAANSTFCNGAAARQNLIDTHAWTITDGGPGNCVDPATAFTTVWRTTAANESITIPTAPGETYNYFVNWGDGTAVTLETGSATHTYATAGDYTVRIDGIYPAIYMNVSSDVNKLREVSQWGDNAWASMFVAFFGCQNMDVTAADVPDLSGVTDMTAMFMGCTNLIGNAQFGLWDVSSVEVAGQLFQGATLFDQDLSAWNMSNVFTIGAMFLNATSFDQDLSSWDISSLQYANDMFQGAGLSTANYDNTLIGWNTLDAGETTIPQDITFSAGSSTYCNGAAARQNLIDTHAWTITDGGQECVDPATAFTTVWRTTAANESITIPTEGGGYNYFVNWGDGTAVTLETGDATHTYTTAGDYSVRISGMFPRIYFSSFNPTINPLQIIDVSQWGSNTWTSMSGAFSGCANLDVTATDSPDLSEVSNMSVMFDGCSSLQGTAAFNTWNTSSVTDMTGAFQDATNFNQPIDNWNTSNVHTMLNMFFYATNFNQSINNWNTSNVTDMKQMFEGASSFNQPIGNWNTSNVIRMDRMFSGASSFDQPIGNWNTSQLKSMRSMFFTATSFDQDLGAWDISSLVESGSFESATYLFDGAGLSTAN